MEKLMVEGILLDIEGFINNVIQERHECVNEQYIYWYSDLIHLFIGFICEICMYKHCSSKILSETE